jgi:hypothetical protein
VFPERKFLRKTEKVIVFSYSPTVSVSFPAQMMNGKESQQQQPVGKFSLFTAGLHNKILIDSEQQQNISPPKQLSARSKLPTNPLPSQQQQNPHTIIGANVNKQPKPKRPSSANPRVRSAHQHQQQREPGKIQKNHPILNNPHHHPPPQGAAKRTEPEYEGRNFAILNKFVLVPSRLSSSLFLRLLLFSFLLLSQRRTFRNFNRN